jgi:hypothetical protein
MSQRIGDHEAGARFSGKELVDLTVAVIAIDAWNRLAVRFRRTVGHDTPAAVTTRVDGVLRDRAAATVAAKEAR